MVDGLARNSNSLALEAMLAAAQAAFVESSGGPSNR